jgi:inner membrane protein
MASVLSHEWRRACLSIGILPAFRHRLVSLLSHRLLDSLTAGGKGWAGSGRGVIAPWQVIRVAPFKLEAYLTARGER